MISRSLFTSLVVSAALFAAPAFAEVIGYNSQAPLLTAERAAALPEAERSVWMAYLRASEAQKRADMAILAAERQGLDVIPGPAAKGNGADMPLGKPADWYATPEARHVADVIVSFQTPAGGWGKNMSRSGQVRARGQSWTGDADMSDWAYVGTFDNGATTTELKFLARVGQAVTGTDGAPYQKAVLRGLDYMLAAQFPNGGWPQVWPLQGGYHDGITFNDDALIDVAGVLEAAAEGRDGFGFVPQAVRDRARSAVAHAVACILDTQVRIDGKLTVWGQQHDALTLMPMAARNFEPPALSSTESAGLLIYLMRIDAPSPRVIASVHAGVAWLKAAALRDVAWVKTSDDRVLLSQPGAPLLWSRYYDLKTGKPIFGDRDKTIHDDVAGLSLERRTGYSWYNTRPKKALDAYAEWSQSHPQ